MTLAETRAMNFGVCQAESGAQFDLCLFSRANCHAANFDGQMPYHKKLPSRRLSCSRSTTS